MEFVECIILAPARVDMVSENPILKSWKKHMGTACEKSTFLSTLPICGQAGHRLREGQRPTQGRPEAPSREARGRFVRMVWSPSPAEKWPSGPFENLVNNTQGFSQNPWVLFVGFFALTRSPNYAILGAFWAPWAAPRNDRTRKWLEVSLSY